MDNMIESSGGSRIWGAFEMKWEAGPSELTVTVTVGGSDEISYVKLTPDNAQVQVDGTNGQYTIAGNVVAAFEADGKTGALRTDQPGLTFDSPNTHGQHFSGLIGTWG